jgi:hypothetical protein
MLGEKGGLRIMNIIYFIESLTDDDCKYLRENKVKLDESAFTGTLHKLYYKYAGNTSTMSNCEKRAEYMMPNIDKFYKLLADKKLWCIYNYPKMPIQNIMT